MFAQGQGRVDPADSQFIGKTVPHRINIAYNLKGKNG
jgi:hypothetical protein